LSSRPACRILHIRVSGWEFERDFRDDDMRYENKDDDDDNEEGINDKDPLDRPNGIMPPHDPAMPAPGSPATVTVNESGRPPGYETKIAAGSLESGLVQGFVRFANWAFGAEGLPDLKVLEFGDFSYEGRYARHNLLVVQS
jgi:hypothetical protein